jgi:hypothetical protein
MNIREVLREMELYAEDDNYGPDVGRWLIAIRSAMEDPIVVAAGRELLWMDGKTPENDDIDQWFFSVPPEKTAEINQMQKVIELEVLHSKLLVAEIERLTALFEATRFDKKQHSEALDEIERLMQKVRDLGGEP